MQPRPGLRMLFPRQRIPMRGARPVFPSRHTASPGRPSMQDRPIERRVDDLVVGHSCPLFLNTLTLSQPDVHVTFDRSRVLNGSAR